MLLLFFVKSDAEQHFFFPKLNQVVLQELKISKAESKISDAVVFICQEQSLGKVMSKQSLVYCIHMSCVTQGLSFWSE